MIPEYVDHERTVYELNNGELTIAALYLNAGDGPVTVDFPLSVDGQEQEPITRSLGGIGEMAWADVIVPDTTSTVTLGGMEYNVQEIISNLR